jgi:hypothetical protein
MSLKVVTVVGIIIWLLAGKVFFIEAYRDKKDGALKRILLFFMGLCGPATWFALLIRGFIFEPPPTD